MPRFSSMYAVEVKHRFRYPFITFSGIIPCHYENVLGAGSGQRVELAFYIIAVLVLTGEMDNRLYSQEIHRAVAIGLFKQQG